MEEIDLGQGVAKSLDSLIAGRLALICGAGLSMAAPSSLPSAAALASKAKQKYDATFGPDRDPLPESIDEQAEFFFQRGELETTYLRTYIDRDAFAARPNSGHFAIADLLLIGAIITGVSTNVDTLIESAANSLFGQVGVGTTRDDVARLPPNVAPLLKIHGCWSRPAETVWACGQIAVDPLRTRIGQCGEWLQTRLLDRDLLIIGYATDWDYLNQVLENSFGAVNPTRVTVVNLCETAAFRQKAPALFGLGERANEFYHVRCSGDSFLEKLRIAFSRSFIRRIVYSGRQAFIADTGINPTDAWSEPISTDAEELWRIRRDLEGCGPNEPAKAREPLSEPLLGLTILQLQALGAIAEGSCWNLAGDRIRVLRAANQLLNEVEAAFERETPPVTAPDYVVAVGAENSSLPPSFARGSGSGSIARGAGIQWLSRIDAVTKFNL